jgi:hypothetical protein
MFRVKAALIAAGVVATVTVGAFFYASMRLEDYVKQRVEATVLHAQQQLVRSSRLESVDLTALTAGFAREDEFAKIFAAGGEQARRAAAGSACDGHNGRLEKAEKKAGIIGVVDARGHLVARDLSYNWRYDDDLTKDYPSLAAAIAPGGQPNKDVWEIDGTMYRVGAAAIRDASGRVLGGVFVGYVQSAGDASKEAERSGVDVAYFYESRAKGGMKIHASSFKRAEGASSESAEEKALAEQIFAPGGPAAPAIEKHEESALFHVKINGEDWVAGAAPLTGNVPTSSTKSGFVVLTSLNQARAPLSSVPLVILLVGLVGMLGAVGAATLNARRFLGPLDSIEAGVTEVINGNQEYVFEKLSPDFEGLANGLNVMLSRLTGRPEPGDDDAGEEEEGLFVDEAAAAAPSPEAAALAAEPADAYYQRIWREYAQARQQTGEGLEGLDGETFLAKLRQNEAALARKYGARMVRFVVVVKGNQVTLKPVPIA